MHMHPKYSFVHVSKQLCKCMKITWIIRDHLDDKELLQAFICLRDFFINH